MYPEVRERRATKKIVKNSPARRESKKWMISLLLLVRVGYLRLPRRVSKSSYFFSASQFDSICILRSYIVPKITQYNKNSRDLLKKTRYHIPPAGNVRSPSATLVPEESYSDIFRTSELGDFDYTGSEATPIKISPL